MNSFLLCLLHKYCKVDQIDEYEVAETKDTLGTGENFIRNSGREI
jgi:hypothetical protein